MGKSNAAKRPASSDAVALPAVLDVRAFQQLSDLLLPLIEGAKKNLILDASKVEALTTPCAQLLTALMRDGKDGGYEVEMQAPSPAMLAAWDDLGLGESFPLQRQ